MTSAHRPEPADIPKRASSRVTARERERLRSLQAYAVLDTPPEAAFERLVRLAARALGTPIALVSFVDRDRQWFKATCGLGTRETSRRISFCSHAIKGDDVMVVPDATLDVRFADNPLVTGKPYLRFYAGAPLVARDGQKLGTVCVLDHRSRELDDEGRRILRDLAATVVDELELRRSAANLRLQIAHRERAERELARALRSVESQVQARTAELSHRNEELRAEIAGRRESELRFRELTENIKEVFWMLDADAKEVLFISPAWEVIWGRSLRPGQKVADWVDSIHPDDRGRVTKRFLEQAALDDFEEEYRIQRPDGEERWVHDRAFVIRDANGQVHRIAGVATDITERRRQETVAALRARQQKVVAELGAFALKGGETVELLREASRVVRDTLKIDFCGVAEHLPERGMFVARAGSSEKLASGQLERLPLIEIPDGRASGSGYALLTGEAVVIENAATEKRFQVSQWIHDTGAVCGVVVLIGGDGTQLPTYGTFNVFSCSLRVFSPDDVFFLQGVANVLASAISRRRGEESLELAREEAELANSAKSSFLSRMSHELRTPLNAILGFSQLLQMDVHTDRQRECIRHVLASGQQLLTLIDDVLDISRLDLGGGALTPDTVVAREAVALAIDAIRPRAVLRTVVVEQEDTPAADRGVFINRQRLQQILVNLLSNAVKYNRPGGRVTVSCRAMPAARLRIAVKDTGPGIAAENLARLFVPFDRLGAERTGIPGTGLGLALCKNLVEAQAGQIGVESTVGEGSTFWIQIPLAPPTTPATASPGKSRSPLRPGRGLARRRVRTILYVEDNLSNLRLIERLLLRRPALQLLTATRGRDGLDLARKRRPDMILLDSHLPDLSGLEVLAALRNDPATRAIPVIAVSADAHPASIEALRAAGARHYLTKPLDIRRLVEMLTELA